MLRRAVPGDMPRLIRMRAEAADQTPAEVEQRLRHIVQPENLLLLQRKEDPRSEVDAMVAVIPVSAGQRHGLWFSDLYTRPELRGQGLMARLLRSALRAGACGGYTFAVAVPPNARARAYLAKVGFSDAFPVRMLERSVERCLWAQAEVDTLTVRQLQSERRRYHPQGVMLPDRTMEGIVSCLYGRGLTAIADPDRRAYGLFFTDEERMDFIELQADNDHCADTLLQAARNHTGLERVRLLLSDSQPLYQGLGKRYNYGMICYLRQPFSTADVYFRTLL